MKKTLIIALISGMGLTTAHAADSGFYLGGSLGKSKMSDFSGSDVDAVLASVGATSTSTTDNKDTGWKAFAGYRIMKYLAVEGAYTNFGDVTARSTITAPAPGTLNLKVETQAWSLSALGILPLNDKFSLFGRLGFNVSNSDVSVSATGSGTTYSSSDSDNDTGVLYGLGAAYHFTPNVNLRAEWERYDSDGSDMDFVSVGLGFSF